MQIEVRQWIERYQGCDEAGDPIVNGRANGFHEQILQKRITQRRKGRKMKVILTLCVFAPLRDEISRPFTLVPQHIEMTRRENLHD
jgi:hypothetical protein